MKGFTEKNGERVFYKETKDGFIRIQETQSGNELQIRNDFPTIRIDKRTANRMSKLLKHFAKHGTLPIPRKQEPIKWS